MHRRSVLVAVSASQLVVGIVGARTALIRGLAFDLPLMHGRVERMHRDAVVLGAALSAPGLMMSVHAAATVQILRRPEGRAARILSAIGAGMIVGHLGEKLVRLRLRPSQWDPVETTISVAGLVLSSAMAILGMQPSPDTSRPPAAH